MRLSLDNNDLKAIVGDKESEIERLQKNIEQKDSRIRKMLVENERVKLY